MPPARLIDRLHTTPKSLRPLVDLVAGGLVNALGNGALSQRDLGQVASEVYGRRAHDTLADQGRAPLQRKLEIRLGEPDTEEGTKVFVDYQRRFRERFFQGTQVERMEDWDEPQEYYATPNLGSKG